ncbi:hypothetical protein J22TS1_08970 [Siminovitchia terrae]|nr:hypothetical protein J22TS1_08970 [Siminovitchia terrae]
MTDKSPWNLSTKEVLKLAGLTLLFYTLFHVVFLFLKDIWSIITN